MTLYRQVDAWPGKDGEIVCTPKLIFGMRIKGRYMWLSYREWLIHHEQIIVLILELKYLWIRVKEKFNQCYFCHCDK